jgi:gliding motility-associated-like protein
MHSKTLLTLLILALTLTACNGTDGYQFSCPSGNVLVQGSTNNKGFIFPNAFTPNGDGRNDRFRLVTNDSNALRDYLIDIKTPQGKTIHSVTKTTPTWDGFDNATNTFHPTGKYSIEYFIILDNGTAAGAEFKGQTCLTLLRGGTQPNCVTPLEDWHNYLLEDMIEPITLTTPYSTSENFCQ